MASEAVQVRAEYAEVCMWKSSRSSLHNFDEPKSLSRSKGDESAHARKGLRVTHERTSLAGLHVSERLQSPLVRSKVDKSPQFGKADSHPRAREPCKSPMRPRALRVCMYAKGCKVHLRGQRLTSLHNSERLIVSRVHNAHARPRARKAWKSLNGSKALQVP